MVGLHHKGQSENGT